MASNSEIKVIHVRLLDEPVPVWRPVLATECQDGNYRINEQVIPDYEVWEFLPGQIVSAEEAISDGESYWRAIAAPGSGIVDKSA